MIHYHNIQTARATVCALERVCLELQHLCDSGEDLRELESAADEEHRKAFQALADLEKDYIYQENRLSNLRSQGFTVTYYGSLWKLEKGAQSKTYPTLHDAAKFRFSHFD